MPANNVTPSTSDQEASAESQSECGSESQFGAQPERSGNPQVSFVVPCYNEANNIAGTVSEIETAAQQADLASFEIIIIDDASTDSTAEVITQLAASKSHIVHVSNAKNLGFGGTYKEGIKRAAGTYVIMIPGDNAHPANGITPILRKAGEADIVIPYINNSQSRPWYRRLASTGFTALINSLFGLDVPYFNGLVLHKGTLLKQIDIRTNGFAYQAEALVKLIRNGATHTTIGVDLKEDNEGQSSAFRPKNVCRVLKAIVVLRLTIKAH